MIWLKSFGRALTTAFEFGLSGFFLGIVVNGFWGAMVGAVLSIPIGFWRIPQLGSLPQRLVWGVVLGAIGGAMIGSMTAGFIMGISGLLRGWRPHAPDFSKTFRSLTWGAWLSLAGGGITGLMCICSYFIFIGKSINFADATLQEWFRKGLIACYVIGAIAGAFTPDSVDRFITAWKGLRRTIQPAGKEPPS
jgi:hypothetical protein